MRGFVLLGCLIAGCGGGAPSVDAGPGLQRTFIALAGDFDGYSQWQGFDLGNQPGGSVHLAGPRTVFLNRLPPHGSTSFPVGTILVKVVHPGGPDAGRSDQVFAMAKRGGDFNDGGAAGWEWFELDPLSAAPKMIWRGATPPPKQGYGGGAGGACNQCHAVSVNDSVLAEQLQLATF